MGSAASKAARKASKAVPLESTLPPSRAPTFPSSSTSGHSSGSGSPSSPSSSTAQASVFRISETKNDDIRRDGQDPTLIANLTALGTAPTYRLSEVPRSRFTPDNRMLDILSSRSRYEDASSAGLGGPSAQSLSNLLDERKSCRSRSEFEDIAKEYGIDPLLVDELTKTVNSISVESLKVGGKPRLNEEGEETQLAKWIDPPPVVARPKTASGSAIDSPSS